MKIPFNQGEPRILLTRMGPRRGAAGGALVVAGLLAWAGWAPAAVLRVPQDYGSVRLAYAAAANDDTIVFDASESGEYLTTPGEFTPEKRVLLMSDKGDVLITANIPPPNDAFESRTALTGQNVAAYTSTYAATSQAGEPPQLMGRTVWWTWTAPSVCPVHVSTEGSGFSPTLAFFPDTTFANLATQIFFQADDWADLNPSFPGQVYIIAVYGKNGAAGELVLRITTPAPTNDLIANATRTAGSLISDEVGNCGAGHEAGEPSLGGDSGRSVWWTWTAPYESEAQIALTDLDHGSPLLGVYTGTTIASLTPVSGAFSSLDGTNRVLRFHATAGMIYSVVGDRDSPDAGRLRLRIRQRPPLNIAGISYLGTNSHPSGQLALTADVTVANTGGTDSNPLRLRLLSGVSVSANNPPGQIEWTRQPLAPPSLAPGATNVVRLETLLPNPGAVSRDVILVLDEVLEDQWLIQDARNLFTYDRGGISSYNDGINNGGAVLLTPPLLGGAYAPWNIQETEVHANHMVEGMQQQLYGTARFTNENNVALTVRFTNTLWTFRNLPWAAPSPVANSTNGFFSAGSVTKDTRVTLSAAYRFAGVTNEVSTEIIITNLPSPLLTGWPAGSTLANGTFNFNLRGVPGRRHRVQATRSFANPPALTVWQDLATNTLGADGLWHFFDSSGGATNAPRYYRVQELP